MNIMCFEEVEKKRINGIQQQIMKEMLKCHVIVANKHFGLLAFRIDLDLVRLCDDARCYIYNVFEWICVHIRVYVCG